MNIKGKQIRFFGGQDFFSNFYILPQPIPYDGFLFHTSEALFMYCKAKVFGDEEVAQEIVTKTKNPVLCKKLGRSVRGYDDEVWNRMRYGIMEAICKLKYLYNTTNPQLQGLPRPAWFIEESPYDSIWGVGRDGQGQNMLGNIWTDIFKDPPTAVVEIPIEK